MKIVRIIGGLGNQMFQFAFYLALKKKFPNEVIKLDLHGFQGYGLHNGFELASIFPVDYQLASLYEILKIAYPYPNFLSWRIGKHLLPKRKTMCCEPKSMSYDTSVFEYAGKRYFEGYWQNENYIKDCRIEILRAFTFPKLTDNRNLQTLERLLADRCVSIHVRRGDYLIDPLFQGTCTIEYYKQAISYIQEKNNPVIYCIFSDDINWCRENITPLIGEHKIIYVDWNIGKESYRDMQLMAMCRYNIIANSSFSWWGAWLNEHSDKIVVAPQKWANIEGLNSPVCNEWIRF